ncbi:hypothetical protein SAMN05444157_1165 [Frankineae bacterium MT45]|nr:hypothetical protein SAMN05444157_1165 [Frankineae bacterium MT45]
MPHKRVALLLRRWYVVLLTLVITVGLASAAIAKVPATYTSSANVLLIPPAASGANPYLALGGLGGVGDVLSLNLSGTDVAKILAEENVTGSYTVATDSSSSAPLITVTATDKTAAGALATMHAVESLLSPRLLKIQKNLNVPSSQLLTLQPINADVTAKPIRKSQQRAVIAAVGFGLLIGFGMLAGIENISQRRARKRAALAARQQAEREALEALAADGIDDSADAPATDEAAVLVNGTALNGALNGSAVNGSSVNGHANGSALNGHTNGTHTNGTLVTALSASDSGDATGAATEAAEAPTAAPAKWSLFRRRRRHAAHVAVRTDADSQSTDEAEVADASAESQASSSTAQTWPAQPISLPEIGYVPVRRRGSYSYERD